MAIPQTATGELLSVSCWAADGCEAVGSAITAAGQRQPMAERLTSAGWRLQSQPEYGGTDNQLNGVSCSGPDDCLAVGASDVGTQYPGAIAASWNGSAWSEVAIPPSTGPLITFAGVSCPSAGECMAVGRGLLHPLVAASWNGSAWDFQYPSLPSDGTAGSFDAVSCPSASACEAVGSYVNSSGTTALAEQYAGSAWTPQTVPVPSGTSSATLTGVSCPSGSSCMAVGNATTSSGAAPFAAKLKTASWTGEPVPAPSGATVSDLYSVSCPEPASCSAVGYANDSTALLAEGWNGSAWTVQATPTPPNAAFSALESVSCTAKASCQAAGGVTYRTCLFGCVGGSPRKSRLAAGPADTTVDVAALGSKGWSLRSSPALEGAAETSMQSVACAGSTCRAVGQYLDWTAGTGGQWVQITEVSAQGGAWSLQTLPVPSGGAADPVSISCSSAGECSVLGNGPDNVVYRWNGTSWAIETLPVPTGLTALNPQSISCPAADACTVVGSGQVAANHHFVPVADRWNGSRWQAQAIPVGPGAFYDYLNGVSCPTQSVCVAAGSYEDSGDLSVPFAEVWNGQGWKVENVPVPSGDQDGASLASVSCSSASACTAGGSYAPAEEESAAMAARYNGKKWTLQSLPGDDGQINSLSCWTASRCAGADYNVGIDHVLQWNGSTWSDVSITGAVTDPEGVSCTTLCTGVGTTLAGAVDVPEAARS